MAGGKRQQHVDSSELLDVNVFHQLERLLKNVRMPNCFQLIEFHFVLSIRVENIAMEIV